jgi:type II secretory ATPase GspE/PulE/Tfp pilus assembly ATPase PilB-like protein
VIQTSTQKDIHIFISSLIERAISLNASDIHIDPRDMAVHVRLRIAGNLHESGTFESELLDLCIGKIKVLSSLRSDVHDRTQDGRFYYVSDETGERVDIRVSIAPTFFGENCVMRLLRPEVMQHSSFFELGMTEGQIHDFKKALHRNSGLVVVAGPTGSGKTSTLYAALRYLTTGMDVSGISSVTDEIVTERNIVTIEDPVESALPAIRQIQVQHDKGFGFKEALRGILRQDPDVVMIGEIRDKDTALAAIQTALTGHLVLTTIHAPNAASIIPRMIEMGVEPYMLSSSISLILSQRLIRVFDYALGLYGDRKGVFEIVPINTEIREMIHEKKTPYEIEQYLTDSGHVLLRDACQDMYSRHVTTEEEAKRISLDIYS